MTKKEAADQKKKAALRLRLIDTATGAGIEDVDQGEYWSYDLTAIERLMDAVDTLFRPQNDSLCLDEEWLLSTRHISKYDCLDTLTDWLFNMGYRA